MTNRTLGRRLLLLIGSSVWMCGSAAGGGQDAELGTVLNRLAVSVEQYYARAQSIVGVETVSLVPLGRDLIADGHVRRLVYDLKVEWSLSETGTPAARVRRELVRIDGRSPRPGEEPECLDPKPVTPEPLEMLLRDQQEQFVFSLQRSGRLDGRTVLILAYGGRTPGPPVVTWRGSCATVDLPGRTYGRIWLDPATADVLRLDEGIRGLVEFPVPRAQQRRGAPASVVIERADSSIRYEPVTFRDPDERVLLPSSIETVTVMRNVSVPRLRITQRYSNYRRFVTEGRVVQ